MIKYAFYIWNSELKKYCYAEQLDYQAKIVENETIRWNMKRFKVAKVEHDLDTNIIDLYLYLEEEENSV